MKKGLAVVHTDGVYKVYRNGTQLRVPLRNGKQVPVQFEHQEAAEGCVRAYRRITRQASKRRSIRPDAAVVR